MESTLFELTAVHGVNCLTRKKKHLSLSRFQTAQLWTSRSLALNLFAVMFDTLKTFAAVDRLFPDDLNQIAQKGLETAFAKTPTIMSNPDPQADDLLALAAEAASAMFVELGKSAASNIVDNFYGTIARLMRASIETVNVADRVVAGAKALERVAYLLTSATPLESYILVVGDPTASAPDSSPPSVPTSLTGIATSSSEISLSWNSNTESDLAGYDIYRNGGYLKSVVSASATDTGLQAGTQYCYIVIAYDTYANRSAESEEVCLETPPVSETPPPAPIEGYLQFEEGNPGTEGDGVFIESSLLNFPYFSLIVDPKPVIGTNIDGTTITVFTELPSAQEFAQLSFEFGYLGTSCLVLVDDNDVVFSLKTTGEATYYSSAVLTRLTDGVRQLITEGGATITNSSGCSGASVSNMFLNRIEFLKFDLNPVGVDAVSIDPGIVRR